ncbi:hypothetical protein [Candidatus Entotheonella palauensis]|uniref:hypothetical protein n=1 Tax=Candidatus Entotheonella palauensis TaxID=93172 RepID=UPI000B7C5D9A|nr:hypothetical protein [Candidatus Entotheonella palauensis]
MPKQGQPEVTGFLFRSPDAIFRHLGHWVPSDLKTPPEEPTLLAIHLERPGTGANISTKYQNVSYYIAKDDRDSMRTLSLLAQILSLHKSRDELPATQSVIRVGS